MEKSSLQQSSANYSRLTTVGSECPRLSGRTCTLPDGGPVDLVTGGHQNCRYSCCISMLTPIWHTLPFFVVDISSEKTEKGYVAEVR
jgi:hypothetical protein